MLYYAIVFAVLALVAGLLGFVALSGTLAWIAKTLLLVFVVLFVLSLVFGRGRGSAGRFSRDGQPSASRSTIE